MKLQGFAFHPIDWPGIAPTQYPGATGAAVWRTAELGDARVRMVEYSPGYVSDHWCGRGHIILVLEGEFVTDLSEGRRSTLHAGETYVIADGDAHLTSSPGGARLFIVD